MTFKLELGRAYLARNGHQVIVKGIQEDWPTRNFYGSNGVYYNSDGLTSGAGFECEFDLVTPLNIFETGDDMVNKPPHYTQGGIECIEAIRAQLTPEEFRGYCKGAVAKYVWREKHKGGDESLRKAAWYLKQIAGEGNE